MDRIRRGRAARLVAQVADRLPKAFVGHPQGRSLVQAADDLDWWRGPHRFVLPRPDALDHWEATRLADPWLYVEFVPEGSFLGLQAEGPAAREVLERLLTGEHAARLGSFLKAAARLDETAETAAVAVQLQADGRWTEAVVAGRALPTVALGAEVLAALLAAAADAPEGGPGAPRTSGVRLARVPVDEADAVALRRVVQRLVDLWRPLWGIPVVRPRAKKVDLDARLSAAYRRSLRLIAGRMGPVERADLRVEVRSLQVAYREASLQRPRLLDIVSERLGLL